MDGLWMLLIQYERSCHLGLVRVATRSPGAPPGQSGIVWGSCARTAPRVSTATRRVDGFMVGSPNGRSCRVGRVSIHRGDSTVRLGGSSLGVRLTTPLFLLDGRPAVESPNRPEIADAQAVGHAQVEVRQRLRAVLDVAARRQRPAAAAGQDDREVVVGMAVAVGIAAAVDDHRVVRAGTGRRRPSSPGASPGTGRTGGRTTGRCRRPSRSSPAGCGGGRGRGAPRRSRSGRTIGCCRRGRASGSRPASNRSGTPGSACRT